MARWMIVLVAGLILTGCPNDSSDGGGNGKLADGSFNGDFSGSGKVAAQGLSLNCEDVRITIDTDDATYFNVNHWEWNCGGYRFANSPVRATIEGDKVYVNGEDYGSFANSTISLLIEGEAGEKLKLKASAFETSLEIREEYTSSEGQATFTGNLSRVSVDEEGCPVGEECRSPAMIQNEEE